MDPADIMKTVLEAQATFFESLNDVRKEAAERTQMMQATLIETFNRAHAENKEGINKIAILLEKQNGRISALERWRTGIIYVLVFIQAAWASFLAYMGWKR